MSLPFPSLVKALHAKGLCPDAITEGVFPNEGYFIEHRLLPKTARLDFSTSWLSTVYVQPLCSSTYIYERENGPTKLYVGQTDQFWPARLIQHATNYELPERIGGYWILRYYWRYRIYLYDGAGYDSDEATRKSRAAEELIANTFLPPMCSMFKSGKPPKQRKSQCV